MQKIITFLTFNDQALEAATFYVSLFPGAKLLGTSPGPGGTVMAAQFELFGQMYAALNGGPTFTFSEGMSLLVNCETQDEIDELWSKLSAGGSEGRCGWLKDKFGVSWQIVPAKLPRLLQQPGALQAMLKMKKLDIAELERAAK